MRSALLQNSGENRVIPVWPPRRLREIRGFLGIRRGHSLHPSFGVSPRHTDRGAIADDGILGSREPLESWLNCDCYRGASRVNQRDAVHEIPTPYFLTPRGGRWWVSGPPSLKLYSSNHGTLLYRRLCGPSLELDYVALRQQCNAPNGLLSAVCLHRQTRYRSSADDAVRIATSGVAVERNGDSSSAAKVIPAIRTGRSSAGCTNSRWWREVGAASRASRLCRAAPRPV